MTTAIVSVVHDGLTLSARPWPPAPDRPTLVFVHGAGQSRQFWTHVLPFCTPSVNALAIDLPGHGESPGAGCPTIAGYREVLCNWLVRAGIPQPIPVGLSMGGAVVLQTLLDSPDLCPAGILVSSGARLRVHPNVFAAFALGQEMFLDLIRAFSFAPTTAPVRLQSVLADMAAQSPEVVRQDFMACDAFDVRDRVAGIRVPVLIVTAGHDRLTPPKYGEWLASQMPRARLTHIAAGGHLLPAEFPDEFASAINDFLVYLKDAAHSATTAMAS